MNVHHQRRSCHPERSEGSRYPTMNVHNQRRACHPERSEGSDASATEILAALRMTCPTVIVNVRAREDRRKSMQFGRCFEEFEIGALYKHWPGRTSPNTTIRSSP